VNWQNVLPHYIPTPLLILSAPLSKPVEIIRNKSDILAVAVSVRDVLFLAHRRPAARRAEVAERVAFEIEIDSGDDRWRSHSPCCVAAAAPPIEGK
jgi:hypothetical protein